jgi:hypothetical protein
MLRARRFVQEIKIVSTDNSGRMRLAARAISPSMAFR